MVRAVRVRGVIAVLAAGLMLGGQQALPAGASTHHPTGNYVQFVDCPLATIQIDNCIFAMVDGGAVVVGRKTVPISGRVTVQGGFYEAPAGNGLVFVGAESGNTLSASQISIPGGLTGIIAAGSLPLSLQAQLKTSPTAVTMTMQLAKPASAIVLNTENFLFEEGIALQLPLKIKLNNQFLGNNCYLGSPSNPLTLSLTTGTTSPPPPNKPIKGWSGIFGEKDGFRFLSLTNAILVDNSFAAPQATGCGGVNAPLINHALDAAIGLPSTTGHNAAILNDTFDIAATSAVHESE